MSKNITINGASFQNVPSIKVPITGSTNYATFIDEDDAGGGSIAGITEIYSNDALSITYTSTSAGTAKSIPLSGLANYPFIVVIIQNTASDSTKQFVRSATVISNINYKAGSVSANRYGSMQYHGTSSTTLTNTTSTSYGLWGYTVSTSALTIRGRVNTSYFDTLTGTYKIKVLGISF